MSAPPVSVYLHVPFCTVKCAYCDFNSYAGAEDLIPAWETAVRDELVRWAGPLHARPVPTVFLGGGTPSLLEREAVERILSTIAAHYALQADAEITLEANPESVRANRLAGYRAAGVNRISMGVQSLDPDELRFLDRLHDGARAEKALRIAREAGFDNINLDLIFGLPGQALATWQTSLEGVLAWAPEHLSCYALTVEEGTPLAARVARGTIAEPDPDIATAMAEWTEDRLATTGYTQYEISNYARPGRECRHNLVYWRGGDYVGVGPGAHGYIDGVRYSVERSPTRYVAALRNADGKGGGALDLPSPAAVTRETPDAHTSAVDALTMRLRLNEGIDARAMAAAHASDWPQLEPALAWGQREALLAREGDRLRLTTRGRRLANELFVRLLEPSLVD